MKKMYTGLKAEKVDFGRYVAVTQSCEWPSYCTQIVAVQVDPGGNKCNNPPDTTAYMWISAGPSYCDEED